MDKLFISGTYVTPQLHFDIEKGIFEIEGRVIPKDAEAFFSLIFNWIDNYSADKQKPLLVRFCLFYYNTSSSKRIVEIMKRFDELYQKGYNVKMVWEYEEGDEDSLQDSEEYKRLLKLPFEIVKIN